MLSRAMKQVGDVWRTAARRRGLWIVIARVLRNQNFVLGVAAMAVAFFSLLFALSWGDVSLVAPAAASLTLSGMPSPRRVFLHERVDTALDRGGARGRRRGAAGGVTLLSQEQ